MTKQSKEGKKECEEKIWSADISDGYSGPMTCGGVYERVGSTQIGQCNYCKKIIEMT